MTAPHTDGAYALIKNGQIADVVTFDRGAPSDPDEVWLPVSETEDSEPFVDPRVQSRGFATYRIEGDHVVRTFQVTRRG